MPWHAQLIQEQQRRREKNLWRTRHEINSLQSTRVRRIVGGESQEYLNFSSNDYLGLASDPRLAEASAKAANVWGTGSGASHLVSGHQTPHHLLEQELADFVGAESALLFSTGYMANLAIPAAFLGRGDLLLQDKLNHASLIDSSMLCRANLKRYPHADYDRALSALTESSANRKLLSTDAVFSMDGDMADLRKLSDICDTTNTLLVADDAHGFGVLGKHNASRGSLDKQGLKPTGNILMMGTLGKALGSFGAFIAGDEVFIEQLKQTARTYIYTTALPATVVAATRVALQIIKDEYWRRSHLTELIHYFRTSAASLGLTLMDSQSAIQPLIIGEDAEALKVSEKLEQNRIWVPAIRPPTVPVGTARLRICLSSAHSTDDIDQLIDALTHQADQITRDQKHA